MVSKRLRCFLVVAVALWSLILCLAAAERVAADRDHRWPAVRRAYLAEHPACEACGSRIDLDVHHVQPVHEFPAWELDPGNLITLCNHRHCHLVIGHLGCYQSWNPLAREDAARLRERILARPTTRDGAERFRLQFAR